MTLLVVIDASVAADWLLEDEFDSTAGVALEGTKENGGIVPPLWHYEIRNILLVAERRGRLHERDIQTRLDSLAALPIDTDQETRFLEETLGLAIKHRLSFYDALYLELAVRLNLQLATLDRALFRAALAEGLEVIRPTL